MQFGPQVSKIKSKARCKSIALYVYNFHTSIFTHRCYTTSIQSATSLSTFPGARTSSSDPSSAQSAAIDPPSGHFSTTEPSHLSSGAHDQPPSTSFVSGISGSSLSSPHQPHTSTVDPATSHDCGIPSGTVVFPLQTTSGSQVGSLPPPLFADGVQVAKLLSRP